MPLHPAGIFRAPVARPGRVAAAAVRCLAVPLGAAALMAPALAQEAVPLAPVIVTSARLAQRLDEALPSVTVITRQDIDTSQSRDLVELLGRQAGVEFARSGGPGSQASLFLRGANSNQVLVLVDGVRMNTVLDGAANLGGVSTDSIDHIEIVRGNLSSLYGSEAIGGVVQIFTRAAKGPGAGVALEAGQGRNRDASAYAGVPLGDSLLSLTVAARSQKGYSAIDAGQVPAANPDLDANRNRNGALNWHLKGPQGEVRLWAWGNRNDTDWDDPYDGSSAVPSTMATQVEHSSIFGYGLSGAQRFGAVRVDGSAAITRDDSANVSNVPFSYDNNLFNSRNRDLSLQATVDLGRGVDWITGAQRLDQRGASTGYDPTYAGVITGFSRRVNSLWTGLTGRWGSQQAQANLRHDGYSDAGGATTGLLGWGWSFAPGWKLTAQASTAFRAPSFNDLYYPFYGNPSLRPEHARSQELGLRWAQGAADASLAVYRGRTSDLIEGLAPDYVSRNVAHAGVDGSEWQAGESFGALRLAASLSLDRARDLDTDQALLRRAHANAHVSATYDAAPWRGSFDLQRTGARDDYGIVSGARLQLPGYTLARIAADRAIAPGVRLHLRIENLFDAHYRLVDGYNVAPRTLMAGVDAQW